jgi:hypothetical protein
MFSKQVDSVKSGTFNILLCSMFTTDHLATLFVIAFAFFFSILPLDLLDVGDTASRFAAGDTESLRRRDESDVAGVDLMTESMSCGRVSKLIDSLFVMRNVQFVLSSLYFPVLIQRVGQNGPQKNNLFTQLWLVLRSILNVCDCVFKRKK